MSADDHRVRDSIVHILEAIDRIETYTASHDEVSFVGDRLIQDAVIRNLEIIGEAASRIQTADGEFLKRNSHLRLELAYRMRNALIHGYDAVNVKTVWNTIRSDLPLLRQHLSAFEKP